MSVHVCLIALLFLVGFSRPEAEEESGIPVMLGESPQTDGWSDPSLVDVELLPQEEAPSLPDAAETEVITQDYEETVALKDEETERARQEEEARKQAEMQAERERRAAEERASRQVAEAFGKGARMGSRGTGTGTGVQGTPAGNATQGATAGSAGYGTFDLGGRSIGEGGLPRPVYNVQDEGRVVVTITVNPAGEVIATSIDRRYTNTVNPALRKAAEDAARKARFNVVEGPDNQVGTITYYFNLK